MQLKTRTYRASNVYGLKELMVNIILSTSAFYLSLSSSYFFWFVGQVLLLVCLWRWFAILHTSAHNAFFKSPKLNVFAGHLASIFCLLPFESWKKSHLDHHRWTGWREKDPSLSLPSVNEISPRFKRILDYCWKFHIPIFSVIFTLTKIFSHKNTFQQENQTSLKNKILLPLAHILLIGILGFSYVKILFFPVLMYLMMSDVVTISQHNNLQAERLQGIPTPIPLWKHPLYTRSLKYPSWVSKHVFLYFDKHTLHHLLPNIPHYYIKDVGGWGIIEEPWIKWLKEVKKLPGHQVYLK
jgi:fatty acid desaturase